MTATKLHIRLKSGAVTSEKQSGAQSDAKGFKLKIKLKQGVGESNMAPKKNAVIKKTEQESSGAGTSKRVINRVLSDPTNYVPEDAPRCLVDTLCKIAKSKKGLEGFGEGNTLAVVPAVPGPGACLLAAGGKLTAMNEVLIPPFEYATASRLALLQSHYLSVAKIVRLSLICYRDEKIELPFKVERVGGGCCSNDENQNAEYKFYLWDQGAELYRELNTADIIVEDLALASWKYVVGIYEKLVRNEDLLEEFMDRISDYTRDRMSEFIGEYKEFVKYGRSAHWIDFKEQIYEHIKNICVSL